MNTISRSGKGLGFPERQRLTDHQALQLYLDQVLRAMGADAEIAFEVARHLVRANTSGHDSHGVLRLAQYVAELDRSALHPARHPELLRESDVTALFDAHRGFGQFSTMVATRWAIQHAREHGLAAAAVRHSMHIGRLGEYTEAIAAEGLVGIVTVGIAGPGSGTAAPFGGTQRFLGTNPWSMGVPAAGRPPLIFDAATTTVAEGKVRMARAKGVEVPAGTVLDTAGEPTRRPEDLYAGGTLTLLGGQVAGHKGYGFSLASALISGLAMIGDEEPTPAGTMQETPPTGPRIAGVFLAAVDPAAFGDPAAYTRQVAGVLDAALEVHPAHGAQGVLVAGDPERLSRTERERGGIAIPAATWEELTAISARFGVALPG